MTWLRRGIAIALALLIGCAALSGCRPLVEDAPQEITVYASFHPIYALADAVMSGVPDARLKCLVQPQDICLRNYRLSDWDMALLSEGANAVLMGGRGLESFEGTLFGWGEKGPAVSAVLYNLELYGQDGREADDEAQSHLKGANPHLYMSLSGAADIVESIAASMTALDPAYGETYHENAETAGERLESLLDRERERLKRWRGCRVALMNEALIYVARDYGLDVVEWIDRESGASLVDSELESCLERLSDSEAAVVLIERQAPMALVDALESAGFAVARIDILSTHREGEGFDAYMQIQDENARNLSDALERAQAREVSD